METKRYLYIKSLMYIGMPISIAYKDKVYYGTVKSFVGDDAINIISEGTLYNFHHKNITDIGFLK